MVWCLENTNEHCALRVTHRVLVGGVWHTLLCRLRNLIGKQFARIYPDPEAPPMTRIRVCCEVNFTCE